MSRYHDIEAAMPKLNNRTLPILLSSVCVLSLSACDDGEDTLDIERSAEQSSANPVEIEPDEILDFAPTEDRDYDFVIGGDGSRLVSIDSPLVRTEGTEDPEILAKLAAFGDRSVPEPKTRAERLADLTTKTLEQTDALGDEPVRLLIMLENLPFDFGRLAEADDALREGLIAKREAQLAPSQDLVLDRAKALGAKEMARFWIGGNDVLVSIPASAVRTLATLPGVIGLELDEMGGQSDAAYTAGDSASGMGAHALAAAGYDGNNNSKNGASEELRIALLEHDSPCDDTNYPTPSHPAFADWSGGPSRIKAVWSCAGGNCSATANTGGGHGQVVAGAAMQSTLSGEDPSLVFPQDRFDRTAASREGEIYFYNIGCWYTGVRGALQRAVTDGADIGNMSFSFPTCDAGFDHSNVNQTLYDATWSGMLLVGSSGNASGSLTDVCEVAWPSYRPEVISVAGLNTSWDGTTYANTNLGIGVSSLGGMPIQSRSGAAGTAAGVDLTAPGVIRLLTTANGYSGDVGGSSVAAPLVAGSAANLRDAFYSLGHGAQTVNAYRFLVNMLLMGDGWNGWNFGTVEYGFDTAKPNRRSGYGRTMMWYPHSNSVSGPWAWGTHSFKIMQGQTVTFPVWDAGPESNSIEEWKWAVTWYNTDLEYLDDVDISVYNTCPVGGGPAQYVAGQNDYDWRNRVRLTAAQIGGKCLEMRIYGYSIRPEGLWVDMADMYHG
jgi:hypothetical protein